MRWSLIVMAALLLVGCGEVPPPRGSAQDHVAGVEARARASATAADQAEIDAAVASARATSLGEAADKDPTPAKIEAAAQALATSRVAAAIASAMRRQATSSAGEERQAQAAARQERDDDLAAQDFRSWQRLCRLVGLAAVVAGALIGAAIGYLTRDPRAAGFAGGALIGTGCLVVAFGPATAWLPWAVPIVAVLALAVWAIAHHQSNGVKVALSRTVDALEGKAVGTLADAKQGLHQAIERAGASMRARLTKARAAWKAAA